MRSWISTIWRPPSPPRCTDSLVPRTMDADAMLGYNKVAVAGGVAANSRIRADLHRSL